MTQRNLNFINLHAKWKKTNNKLTPFNKEPFHQSKTSLPMQKYPSQVNFHNQDHILFKRKEQERYCVLLKREKCCESMMIQMTVIPFYLYEGNQVTFHQFTSKILENFNSAFN